VATVSASAAAQAAPSVRPLARLDALAATGHYWRGIWRSGFPVLQLDAAAGLGVGRFAVTAGVWTNYEPRTANGRRRSDLIPGARGFTELAVWGQAEARLGRVVVAGGAMRSSYRRVGEDPEVVEVYGVARAQAGRWSSSLSAWQAVEGAKGMYLEPRITFHNAVNPFGGPALDLATSLVGGVQTARRRETAASLVPGAAGTGLTHLTFGFSLGAGTSLAGGVALAGRLALEAQWRRDPATRVRGDGSRGSWFRLWAPLQVGFTWPSPRSR
jgi:hypothetical protein